MNETGRRVAVMVQVGCILDIFFDENFFLIMIDEFTMNEDFPSKHETSDSDLVVSILLQLTG